MMKKHNFLLICLICCFLPIISVGGFLGQMYHPWFIVSLIVSTISAVICLVCLVIELSSAKKNSSENTPDTRN